MKNQRGRGILLNLSTILKRVSHFNHYLSSASTATISRKLFPVKIRRILVLFLFLSLLPSLSIAQMGGGFHHNFRTTNLILEGRAYYGWTLDHHIEMQAFQRHFPAFEISLLKATYGRTRWEYKYNYPFVGLSLWYSGLGNTEALGSAYAVFPYINFPLLDRQGFNIYFRLGVGLAYLTRPYDRYENYENIAIGSHLNGAVNMLVEARWRMGNRFMTSAGIGLMHFLQWSHQAAQLWLEHPLRPCCGRLQAYP